MLSYRCFVSARTQTGIWQYDLTLAKVSYKNLLVLVLISFERASIWFFLWWVAGLSRSVWGRLFDKLCGGEGKLSLLLLVLSTRLFFFPKAGWGLQTLADVCGVLDEVPLGLRDGIEELRATKVVYSEEEQLQQLLSDQICMIHLSGPISLLY